MKSAQPTDCLALCISGLYPLERRTKNVARHSPLSLYQLRDPWNGALSPAEFSPGRQYHVLDIEGALNVNDMGALADAAIIGTGLAYLPDFMVVDHVEAGELKVVLRDFVYEGEWIYMVYPRRRCVSPRFRVFSDFIRQLLPAPPRWQSKMLHETHSGVYSRQTGGPHAEPGA